MPVVCAQLRGIPGRKRILHTRFYTALCNTVSLDLSKHRVQSLLPSRTQRYVALATNKQSFTKGKYKVGEQLRI